MLKKQKVGGHKTQTGNNTKKEREFAMKGIKNVGERKTQNEVEKQMPNPKFLCGNKAQSLQEHCIKEAEAERIAFLKEAVKGFTLSFETDINTIPVIQVEVKDLCGVKQYPWGGFWNEEEKINLSTPVILDREKNVIAGIYQYCNAKENGLIKIDAVYMDSLYGKILSANNLKNQFEDETICTSFAYNLYALLFGHQYKISYSEFCDKFDELWDEDEIWFNIHRYISTFNDVIGG